MAQIQPFGRQRVRGSATQRPTVQAGRQGQALAQLGQTVSAVGQKVAGSIQQLQQKRRQAEITDFADNTSFNFRRDFLEQKRKLDEQMAGTNYEGYTQRLQAIAQDMEQQVIGQEMDSEKVQAFREKTRSFMERAIISADGEEHQNRARFYTQERIQRAETLAGDFFENPDPFQANEEVSTFVNELEAQEGVLFNKETIDTLKADFKAKVRENMVAGLIRNGLPGIVDISMTPDEVDASVENFLSGRIPGTESLFDDMGADERRKHDRQIRSAAANIYNSRIKAVESNVRSSASVLERMDTLNPDIQRQVNSVRMEVEAMPEGPEKSQMLRTLGTAQAVNDFRTSVHHMDNDLLMREDLPDLLLPQVSLQSAREDLGARKRIEDTRNEIIRKRNEDGAGYVKETSPGIYQDKDLLVEHQLSLGIQNPRVFSQEEAGMRASALLEEQSAPLRASMLEELIEEVGPNHAFSAINEMTEANKDMPKSYLYAAMVPDRGTRQRMIKAIGDNEISTTFKNAFAPAETRQMNNAFHQEFGPISSAFHRANLPQHGNDFKQVAQKMFQDKILRNPSKTPKEAAAEVREDLIDKNFTIVDNPRASFVVPKSVLDDPKIAERFVETSFESPEFVQSLGISKETHGKPDQTEEDFWDTFRANSYWVTDASGDSVVLKAIDMRDAMGVPRVVMDPQGREIRARFDEMGDILQEDFAVRRTQEKERVEQRLGKIRQHMSLIRGRQDGS